MKSFFKSVLATIIGIVFTFFLIIILVATISSFTKEESKIEKKSILKINLDYPIYDRKASSPLAGNLPFSTGLEAHGLNTILKSIEHAKKNKNIKGIFLEVNTINSGLATINEIRETLLDFKSSGKFIVSYSEWHDQSAYYLASVADTVYLNPMGNISLKGLSANITFFKRSLEKIGIEPQIIRHGKFKSAIEPFVNEKMSEENRLQTTTYLNSIWKNMTTPIVKSRNISHERINQIASEMLCRNANDALKLNLIDQLVYYDEFILALKKNLAIEKDKEISFISIAEYQKTISTSKDFLKQKIAVIYAQGDIMSGEGNEYQIGSDRIAKAIRKARKNEKVKAIVLRVNSPGGSSLASDVIWREVELASKQKPIVASMGDVAASGGYYISCAADTIIANPMTLTGSIGVFGLILNTKELMNEKFGFDFDVVKTNDMSDFGQINRPLTKEERNIIQSSIEFIYDDFITKVANGRNLTKEQVDSIGQGRIWSGENAKNIDLIDLFGGLNYSIEVAAKMANLNEYSVIEYPKQSNFIELMLNIESIQKNILKKHIGENYHYYNTLKSLKHNETLMRLPADIHIN